MFVLTTKHGSMTLYFTGPGEKGNYCIDHAKKYTTKQAAMKAKRRLEKTYKVKIEVLEIEPEG